MTLTPVAPETTFDVKTSVIELPAQLLLAAAQFASSDPTKDKITKIQISFDEAGAVIRATNGHIAFRCRMPRQLLDGDYSHPKGAGLELQVPAGSLRKPCAKAQVAVLGGGMIQLLDSKRQVVDMRPWLHEDTVEFPDIDGLWPRDFTYDCGGPIGFSANYMITICQIVKRLSDNGVAAFSFSKSNFPTALDASVTIDHAGEEYPLILEFLLMPVMLKDRRPNGELERFVACFNRREPAKRGQLKARLATGGSWSSSYAVNFQNEDGKLVFAADTLSQATAYANSLGRL